GSEVASRRQGQYCGSLRLRRGRRDLSDQRSYQPIRASCAELACDDAAPQAPAACARDRTSAWRHPKTGHDARTAQDVFQCARHRQGRAWTGTAQEDSRQTSDREEARLAAPEGPPTARKGLSIVRAPLGPGTILPNVNLPATNGGEVCLATHSGRSIVAIYPWTGRPGLPNPPDWDIIPGAHGSTPELQ